MTKDEITAAVLMVVLVVASAGVGLLNYCFGIKTERWMMVGLMVLLGFTVLHARKAFY